MKSLIQINITKAWQISEALISKPKNRCRMKIKHVFSLFSEQGQLESLVVQWWTFLKVHYKSIRKNVSLSLWNRRNFELNVPEEGKAMYHEKKSSSLCIFCKKAGGCVISISVNFERWSLYYLCNGLQLTPYLSILRRVDHSTSHFTYRCKKIARMLVAFKLLASILTSYLC